MSLKPNLMQNGAISLTYVFDDRGEKLEQFALKASQNFDVLATRQLSLLTIRHYNAVLLADYTKGKKIFLQQQTPDTVQVLLQE
ncbi:MAG: hypothetical protein QM727_02070 [Niabella sp.]